MTRRRPAWSLIARSPQRAALGAAVAIGAVALGLGVAFVLNDLREPDVAGQDPSAAASIIESTLPSPSARVRPSATDTEPTPTEVPPSIALTTPTPSPSEPPAVAAIQWPIGLAAMTVVDGLRVRSHPLGFDDSTKYEPVLPQGTRLRLVQGPVFAAGYWWYQVTNISVILEGGITDGWVASADPDGTPWIGPSPEACSDFQFPVTDIIVSSLAELQAGVVAVWGGCVTTPWVPPYWVTITLRSDGTYSGVAMEGAGEPAFYYGTDDDLAEKRYALNDLQDSLRGIGQIDIVFWEGNVNRGDLRNITLMGDRLEFEFFHRSEYGPLTYRLYRLGTAR
jgi:hypothetical protein